MKKRRTIAWNAAVSSGENARHTLPRLASEFFALGRTAAAHGATTAQLHAFRLAAKRFRYTLELFAPLYGPRYIDHVEEVRRIQSLLGDRQDCVVLGERLKKQDPHDPALVDILRKVSADGDALEEKFRRYWQGTFDAPGVEVAWGRYLTRRPPAPRGVRQALSLPHPQTAD